MLNLSIVGHSSIHKVSMDVTSKLVGHSLLRTVLSTVHKRMLSLIRDKD